MKVAEFIHIGLAKTGSTLLQREFFPRLSAFEMFGSHGVSPRMNEHVERLWRQECGCSDLNHWCAGWLREYSNILDSLPIPKSKKIGISNERLSGHFLTGVGRYSIADKLKILFPQARIIIVLRHPLTYLPSVYNQLVRQGASTPMRAILADTINYPGTHIVARLKYRELVGYYRRLFGNDAVLALPMEMMRDDKLAFFNTMLDFLGVEAHGEASLTDGGRESPGYETRNPSFSAPSISLLRLSNFLGLPRVKIRRFLKIAEIRCFQKVLRTRTKMTRERLIKMQPALGLMLENENYRLWTGKLARYNYTFGEDWDGR